MQRLLLVCLAGGIGSGLRYLVVAWAERTFGTAFPWGVFTVNVVGSFLIALIGILALTKAEMTPLLRLTLTTGFLGGLTTYSAFNQDTLSMIDKKLYATALAYIAVTIVGCLAAGFAGAIVGRRV
jgi:fluoride exporter